MHPQKTSFYNYDGKEWIFNCESKCENGAEFIDNTCVKCNQKFKKIGEYSGQMYKQANFQELFDEAHINKHYKEVEIHKENRDNELMELRKIEDARRFCPICAEQNFTTFVVEPEEVQIRGFLTDYIEGMNHLEYAPFGICTNSKCIDDLENIGLYGVPLLNREDFESLKRRKEFFKTLDHTICTSCGSSQVIEKAHSVMCNQCGIELEKNVPIFENKSQLVSSHQGEMFLSIRDEYTQAIRTESTIVDPPYHFSISGVNYHERAINFDKNPDVSPTIMKHKLDWFDQLYPYLSALRRKNGTNKEHIILSCYIDKYFRFRHQEPLWIFAERIKINNRKLKSILEIYNHNKIIFHDVINRNFDSTEPSIENFQNFIDVLISNSNIQLQTSSEIDEQYSRTDFVDGLSNESSNSLSSKHLAEICFTYYCKLKQENIVERIEKSNIGNDLYNFSSSLPLGFIELICLFLVLQKKNTTLLHEIRQHVFPSTSTNSTWREILGENGCEFIDNRLDAFLRRYVDIIY
jgi:hypothetical protein